jgi:diguanylate cyclase
MKAHNQTFTVSFSFGLKEFHANEPCSDILDAADRNMYKDKIEIKKRITRI